LVVEEGAILHGKCSMKDTPQPPGEWKETSYWTFLIL
jgi:hypothetical protein